jgi:RHS repeat-associated protein
MPRLSEIVEYTNEYLRIDEIEDWPNALNGLQIENSGKVTKIGAVVDVSTRVLTNDQWTPVAEWDSGGNLIATNVYGLGDDEILYRAAGSTQLFYKNDPMGNVMFLLNGSGAGVEKYNYDAFGAPTITDWSGNSRTASAFGNRFMFSGRDYLQAFGVYDMRNRMYDPSTGHFHQTDPIGFAGDPANLYRFAGNNPLLGGDPTGLVTVEIGVGTVYWDYGSPEMPTPSLNLDLTTYTFLDSSAGNYASEVGVYDGASFASGIGYAYSGRDEAYMNSIFGPPSESGIMSGQSDLSFAGGVPSLSGTTYFASAFRVATPTRDASVLPTIGLINDLIEITNHGLTKNAQELQEAGKFEYKGAIYKKPFYGNQHPGYSAKQISAAKIGQARVVTAGRYIGGITSFAGYGLAAWDILENGASNRSLVRAGIQVGAPSIALRVPYAGIPLALTIVIVDFEGGFDGLYNRFDNTPRFQLPIFASPNPGPSPSP